MNERHHFLQTALVSDEGIPAISNPGTKSQQIDAQGWRILDEKMDWKPCPIGVFYSKSPSNLIT